MEATNSGYDHIASDTRIQQILNSSESFDEVKEIPTRNKLTYSNGYYVDCTALFIDIRDSSKLPESHNRPVLGKLYRAYLSECVAVINSDRNCREVFINGDCVSGILNSPNKSDIDGVFSTAAKLNSMTQILNWRLEKKGYAQFRCGIGIAYGRALMLKAGFSGSGLNEVIWMGDVVNEASNLCHQGNRAGSSVLQVSTTIYSNLNDHNKGLLSPRPNQLYPTQYAGRYTSLKTPNKDSEMSPKITRRSTLTHIVTTMLVASALGATAAHAASFQFRQPVMGLVSSPTVQSQLAATAILVALTGGPELPAGEVNLPYSYDLKQLLSVTGDSAYNSSNVSWELASGGLPAGLSLGSDGVISGSPTTKNVAGSSFQVLATYKTKTGQQAYTIVVNGAVLHVTQISAGSNYTCAVTTAGGAKCWGYNTSGQLGNNSTTSSKVPVDVVGLTSGVASLTGGDTHTCAVTTSGGAKCWGRNNSGQLGNNSTTSSSVPVDVVGLTSGVASITGGNSHTCAVTTSGGAKCWGYNYYGQLGNNSTTNRSAPVDVVGLTSGVVSLTGGGAHTCAVTTSGGAKCWGRDHYGQLGNGIIYTQYNSPVDVVGLTSGVASLTGGDTHTCAVTTSGGAKCWGDNYSGQLGNNSTTNSKVPVDVMGLTSGVASLTVGGVHACAVTTSGGAKCWGNNSSGQLGNNSTTNSKVPVDVSP